MVAFDICGIFAELRHEGTFHFLRRPRAKLCPNLSLLFFELLDLQLGLDERFLDVFYAFYGDNNVALIVLFASVDG